MRKLIAGLALGLDAALTDKFALRHATLKTGSVVIFPSKQRQRDLAAIIEKQLAAPRYVDVAAEAPPAERVRAINAFIEERWTAVPKAYQGTRAEVMAAVMADGGVPAIAGWKVTQHVRYAGRSFATMSPAEVQEHLLSLQIAPEEDRYAGYYATIKGNDVAHLDGKVLRGKATATHDGVIRGGTEIRSRAHLKRVMKERGYGVWDKGWQRETDRIESRKQQERKERFDVIKEKADKSLPRLLGEL
jgi:hypothetical protein